MYLLSLSESRLSARVEGEDPTFSHISRPTVLCPSFFCHCRPLRVFLSWTRSLCSAWSWFISSWKRVRSRFLRSSILALFCSFRHCLLYSDTLKDAAEKEIEKWNGHSTGSLWCLSPNMDYIRTLGLYYLLLKYWLEVHTSCLSVQTLCRSR